MSSKPWPIQTSFMPMSKITVNEVLTGPERRRRWCVQEKLAAVQASLESGSSVSEVARQFGINPNQLFTWRRQYQEDSLTSGQSGESVVPASELAQALKQIKDLQRVLGKKTLENEILREAVEYGLTK